MLVNLCSELNIYEFWKCLQFILIFVVIRMYLKWLIKSVKKLICLFANSVICCPFHSKKTYHITSLHSSSNLTFINIVAIVIHIIITHCITLQCHVCAFCILVIKYKMCYSHNSSSHICIFIISLILSVAFSRGRLCENVLEGSSHHHVHAQRPGGQLLPGGQSRPAQQQTQTGLGVSFFISHFICTGNFLRK